jgi:hypothetical protein
MRRMWEKVTDWTKYHRLYEDIIEKCDEAIGLDPNSFIPHMNKAAAFIIKKADNYKNNAKDCFNEASQKLDAEIFFQIRLYNLFMQNG